MNETNKKGWMVRYYNNNKNVDVENYLLGQNEKLDIKKCVMGYLAHNGGDLKMLPDSEDDKYSVFIFKNNRNYEVVITDPNNDNDNDLLTYGNYMVMCGQEIKQKMMDELGQDYE